jgi:hypothetical protein
MEVKVIKSEKDYKKLGQGWRRFLKLQLTYMKVMKQRY